jgi:hypothetical protein
MSHDPIEQPEAPDSPTQQGEGVLKLAQELIRKMDEESNKKLEGISAEEKAAEKGAA